MSTGIEQRADTLGATASTDESTAAAAVDLLRQTSEIRRRAAELTDRVRAGRSRWFTIDDSQAPHVAALVAQVTRERYPDLAIPFHSRWRHFEAGGINRAALLDERLGEVDAATRVRAQLDLAVVSVLLDAGAGPDWYFDEPANGGRYTRSEGLAVASVHAFFAGLFSGDPNDPLRVDSAGLRALQTTRLAEAFGVGPDTPLVGLDGRVALLHRLADALDAHPDVFGDHRPGGLYDYLAPADDTVINAPDILAALLSTLSPIWLADNMIDGIPVGDCWVHDAVTGPGQSAGWMPFHKLSQWLTYSLLEPFGWAGHEVTGLDQLTALPEYRNGGLLLDTGMISLTDAGFAAQDWAVGDELVVEWRALIITLLDELAPAVAAELDVPPTDLPLACILEGGTWAAGRALAGQHRGGLPPLRIISDGTVF